MKTVDFSETIAACDLKVGRCRQLIEFMTMTMTKFIRTSGHRDPKYITYIQNKMTSVKHTTISCYVVVQVSYFKKTVNSDFSLLELLYPHLYVQMHRKCILIS